GFFVLMYLSSRSSFFGHVTGETLKWCADTPEGIRVFDSPGVDSLYGIQLQPCTAEQIISLRQQSVGIRGPQRIRVADLQSLEFFDPVSGRPKVCYYRASDGSYELFDGPGRHPGTSEQLKPADP